MQLRASTILDIGSVFCSLCNKTLKDSAVAKLPTSEHILKPSWPQTLSRPDLNTLAQTRTQSNQTKKTKLPTITSVWVFAIQELDSQMDIPMDLLKRSIRFRYNLPPTPCRQVPCNKHMEEPSEHKNTAEWLRECNTMKWNGMKWIKRSKSTFSSPQNLGVFTGKATDVRSIAQSQIFAWQTAKPQDLDLFFLSLEAGKVSRSNATESFDSCFWPGPWNRCRFAFQFRLIWCSLKLTHADTSNCLMNLKYLILLI